MVPTHAQAYAPAAPASSSDRSVWALLAVVIALAAAALGWFIAHESAPSWSDVQTASALRQRDGELAGRTSGYRAGTRLGRREAQLESRLQAQRTARGAFSEGYQSGVAAGRSVARAQRGGSGASTGAYVGGAYPAESFDDVLAGTDLAQDAPGYASPSPAAGYGAGYGSGTGIAGYDDATGLTATQ